MKRELKFDTLSDLRSELKSLGDSPVRTTGVWSFYQILNHLALGVEWAMLEDKTFLTVDPVLTAERARKLWERTRRIGRLSTRVQNPSAPTAREEGPEAQELKRLLGTLDRLEGYADPHPVHPLFGELSQQDWVAWVLLHCAHHLGFAEHR